MDRTSHSFEHFAAERLRQDSRQISHDWVEALSSQLEIVPQRVLPHRELLDDLPIVLGKAADFLPTPDVELLTADHLVTDEMRSIARIRRAQGWQLEEVIREFDCAGPSGWPRTQAAPSGRTPDDAEPGYHRGGAGPDAHRTIW